MALNTEVANRTAERYKQVFMAQAMKLTTYYEQVATIIQSDRESEPYLMLGDQSQMREWLGERQYDQFRSADYRITNKTWEKSLLFDKDKISDGVYDAFSIATRQAATVAATHRDELITDLIVNGEATNWWDDSDFFFDTDHVWGDSGTQNNDLTTAIVAAAAPTAVEFKAAFNTARVAMLRFKNDRGDFFVRSHTRMSDLLVVVPPEYEQSTREALETKIFGPANQGGNENVVIDQPQILPLNSLTDTTKWYLFNVGGPLKPFIFQDREPLTIDTVGNESIEFKDIKFLIKARYNAGYGPWWTAVLTTFTTI